MLVGTSDARGDSQPGLGGGGGYVADMMATGTFHVTLLFRNVLDSVGGLQFANRCRVMLLKPSSSVHPIAGLALNPDPKP